MANKENAARLRAKAGREAAFADPDRERRKLLANAGIKVHSKTGRVTDFGKPIKDKSIVGKIVGRYTYDPVIGARDVARDTIKGEGEAQFRTLPAWANTLGANPTGNAILYNMLANEAFGKATAPVDFIGATGLARGLGKALVSKYGKAALATLGAAGTAGLANEEEASASPAAARALITGGGRSVIPEIKTVLDEGTRRALINLGMGRENTGTEPLKAFIQGISETAPLKDIVNYSDVAQNRANVWNKGARRRLRPEGLMDLYSPITGEQAEELAAKTLYANPDVRGLFMRATHGAHVPDVVTKVGHSFDTLSVDPAIWNLVLRDIPDPVGRSLMLDTFASMAGKRPSKKLNQELHSILGLLHRFS